MTIDREILGGTPVFRGTRIPVQALFDYIEGGDTIEDFLRSFSTVKKSQALNVLNKAQQKEIINKVFNSRPTVDKKYK